MSSLGHMVTRQVCAPAERAYTHLSDPIRLGHWSLGCFQTFLDEGSGFHSGKSLFDGGQGWFRIDPDPARMLIDYWIGTPDQFSHRISVRIAHGGGIGYDDSTCLVMLMAWRPADMSQERWERLCASHEAEIWLIKEQIEAEYRTNG